MPTDSIMSPSSPIAPEVARSSSASGLPELSGTVGVPEAEEMGYSTSAASDDDIGSDADVTLSAREMERLTGVSRERMRTWVRRYDFPRAAPSVGRHRRFYVADVPFVLAARQLVEEGRPVADAISAIRDGGPHGCDLAAVTRALSNVPGGVVVLSGPAPLKIEWSSAAARAGLAPGTALALPTPINPASLTLQRLLSERHPHASRLRHPDWTDATLEREALAWSLGPPIALPAVLVVMDLPGDPAPAARVSHVDTAMKGWLAGAIAGRRALQRRADATGLSAALAAVAKEAGAHDAFWVFARQATLCPSRSVRGRLRAGVVGRGTVPQLSERNQRVTRWLDAPTLRPLGSAAPAGLAITLASSGIVIGFAILEFDRVRDLPGSGEDLLAGFAGAAAAAILRDRAPRS